MTSVWPARLCRYGNTGGKASEREMMGEMRHNPRMRGKHKLLSFYWVLCFLTSMLQFVIEFQIPHFNFIMQKKIHTKEAHLKKGQRAQLRLQTSAVANIEQYFSLGKHWKLDL